MQAELRSTSASGAHKCSFTERNQQRKSHPGREPVTINNMTKPSQDVQFNPVRPLTASLAAVRQLKYMVESGQLSPGDRLPGERELAHQLGISRPTLREAIRALRLMGLIESRPGAGTFVAELPLDSTSRHSQHAPSLDFYNEDDILEMRTIVEPGFAKLAAQRISVEQLDEFRSILDRVQLLNDWTELQRLETRMHQIIAEACGNRPLLDLLNNLAPNISVARSRHTSAAFREHITLDQSRILLALEQRDATAAYQAMAEHLDNVSVTHLARPSDEAPR